MSELHCNIILEQEPHPLHPMIKRFSEQLNIPLFYEDEAPFDGTTLHITNSSPSTTSFQPDEQLCLDQYYKHPTAQFIPSIRYELLKAVKELLNLPPHILFVDANVEDMLVFKTFFPEQYLISMAKGLFNTTKHLIGSLPDLIFFDIDQSPESYKKISSQIQNHTNYKHIPLLLTSRFTNVDTVEEGLRSGASDFILKPWVSEDLKARLDFYLNKQKKNRGTVLVVEDCDMTRFMLEDILTQQGFHVLVSDSGKIGYELALAHKPSLILTDYMMPELSGWDLCCKLKKNPQTASIPIIIISSRQSKIDFKKADILRVEDYITKPIDAQKLLSSINLILMKKEKRIRERQIFLFQQEMNIAKEIQNSLLPQTELKYPELKMEWFWLPAKEAGGDVCFIQKSDFNEEDILIAIADVCGKGVSASLLASATVASLQSAAKFTDEPAGILTTLNSFVHNPNALEQFVTCFICRFNTRNGNLSYSAAGHNGMLHISKTNETVTNLCSINLPCGMEPGESYEQKETKLEPGDRLLLYTDGITDCINAKGQMYGESRLEAIVKRSIQKKELKTASDYLGADIQKFCKNGKNRDDMAFIYLEFCPETAL
jgi:sigma-B regulation protein RsbU (phosphoserine phosphatase)